MSPPASFPVLRPRLPSPPLPSWPRSSEVYRVSGVSCFNLDFALPSVSTMDSSAPAVARSFPPVRDRSFLLGQREWVLDLESPDRRGDDARLELRLRDRNLRQGAPTGTSSHASTGSSSPAPSAPAVTGVGLSPTWRAITGAAARVPAQGAVAARRDRARRPFARQAPLRARNEFHRAAHLQIVGVPVHLALLDGVSQLVREQAPSAVYLPGLNRPLSETMSCPTVYARALTGLADSAASTSS